MDSNIPEVRKFCSPDGQPHLATEPPKAVTCLKSAAGFLMPANLDSSDFTWEREWRIRTGALTLDPKSTLVVVPTADEAFGLVYEFADMEADFDYVDGESFPVSAYHVAHWLAVSLDLFGFNYEQVKNA